MKTRQATHHEHNCKHFKNEAINFKQHNKTLQIFLICQQIFLKQKEEVCFVERWPHERFLSGERELKPPAVVLEDNAQPQVHSAVTFQSMCYLHFH